MVLEKFSKSLNNLMIWNTPDVLDTLDEIKTTISDEINLLLQSLKMYTWF